MHSNKRRKAVKVLFRLVLVVGLSVPLSVSAEVMHYSLCTLNDGKTLADVQAWVNDWRPIAKSAGIDYEVRVLVGHAATADEMLPNFALEGSSPTLSTYAAAWEWWYSDDKAATSNAQLLSAAACGSNSIFTTTE
jgi:hypothetical protein